MLGWPKLFRSEALPTQTSFPLPLLLQVLDVHHNLWPNPSPPLYFEGDIFWTHHLTFNSVLALAS